MRQYMRSEHVVVDKYEHRGGNLNIDILDYHPQEYFDLILSLSTLEHIGREGAELTGDDLFDGAKPARALSHLRRLLNPGGRLVITVPRGWNPWLDAAMDDGSFACQEHYWLKRDAQNYWTETTDEDARSLKFDTPYHFANAIYVGYDRRTGE